MKKNPLALVKPSKANPLAPPSTLREAGRTLWQSIMTEYAITDSGGRAILTQICCAADDLHDCDVAIERDGAMINSRTGPREHPLLKQRLALRAFVVRATARLGLSLEPVKPVGRPPAAVGPTYEDFEADE
jgi:hypothetical protein